jgi:hypothetical protein
MKTVIPAQAGIQEMMPNRGAISGPRPASGRQNFRFQDNTPVMKIYEAINGGGERKILGGRGGDSVHFMGGELGGCFVFPG